MKKRNLLFGLLISLLFPLLFIHSCKNEKEDVINIGVILPMTGDLASYGEPMKVGMEMAFNELNDKNIRFKLNFIDSKAEPSTALSGAQKLINIDKVKYIIGDVSSPVTLALVPLTEQHNVFLLSPGASSPKLNNISPLFARNYPSSVVESIESAKFLFKNRGISESSIIYVNSEYGIGLKEMFEKKYSELGGKIIFSESYDYGRINFREIIAKLNNVNANAIYLGGNQKEMGSFIRQLRESGSKSLVLSNISFLEPDCLNIAGKAADGVIVPVAYYNPNDSLMSGAFDFAQKYYEKFEKQVTIPVAVGYDALKLITTGINVMGDNPGKVAQYIRNLKNYNGALGVISFTDGDVMMPFEFKVIIDQKVENLN